MFGKAFANWFKLLYSSLIGTAMSGVSAYPASGAYLDVSGYARVHILVHWGVVHNSDTPTLTLKCTDGLSGTLDVIDASLYTTPDPTTGDAKWGCFTLEVAKLPADHHFIALATSGTLTNGTYVDISIWGESLSVPVTQSTSLMPAADQLVW
ncbi:MAG: hypothetical protein WC869_10335 [Phycisphaerae bacterium]|jgi:hypothetical protein